MVLQTPLSFKNILCLLSLCLVLPNCANQQFQSLGSTILGSTGIVSSSQADAMFKAGGKIAAAAGPLSAEQEYYLGRSVSAMVLSKYSLSRNRALLSYVNNVGNAVAAFSDRPETFGGYHFGVLESTEINALSAPGGFVFVTSGFLSAMPDEDALAAVLAHEVAHIVKGHGVKAISQANLTEAVTILGKEAASSYGDSAVQQLTSAFGDSVTEVFDTILKNGYSRSQEYEADEYAAQLLKKSGYNQASLLTMLRALEKLAASNKSGGWFSTHPSPSKRVGEIEDEIKPSADPSGVELRAARFKKLVRS